MPTSARLPYPLYPAVGADASVRPGLHRSSCENNVIARPHPHLSLANPKKILYNNQNRKM